MEFAQQLKAQIDIVRVVSDYVRLRRFGNRHSGLCPFHNEKTPSFSVYADHQFFKCFGCDAKGDVFNFLMTIEGLTFWEALRKLADQHGIPLPKQSQAADDRTRVRAGLFELHEVAADHFRANLMGPGGAAARQYLAKRGVTQASIQQFQLGLADGSGRTLLRLLEQRGFKPEQLEASGLMGRREDGTLYDRFRNRLMFPIHSESGKPVAFGGRALDPEEKAKYLNSSETEIYKKSHVLYNLNRAKQAAMQLDRIVLVEGYMDVIGAHQAGVTETVASCGTALTVEQVRLIKRHSLNLHLNFDPDTAGSNAAERSIRILLEESIRVRVVELEEGLDPDEYCGRHGQEAYRAKVAGAKTYFYWLADRARTKFNMREPQGRVDAFQFLLPSVQGLHDKLERVAVANDLASYLGIESGLVLEHFRRMAADRAERRPVPAADPARATDRILLPLLLRGEHGCEELIEQLSEIESLLRCPTGPIYQILLSMHQAGDPLDFNSLHQRLPAPSQDHLAAIVLEAATSDVSLEDGRACLEALRRAERDAMRHEMKSRIRTAEREGRLTEALALMQQLGALG